MEKELKEQYLRDYFLNPQIGYNHGIKSNAIWDAEREWLIANESGNNPNSESFSYAELDEDDNVKVWDYYKGTNWTDDPNLPLRDEKTGKTIRISHNRTETATEEKPPFKRWRGYNMSLAKYRVNQRVYRVMASQYCYGCSWATEKSIPVIVSAQVVDFSHYSTGWGYTITDMREFQTSGKLFSNRLRLNPFDEDENWTGHFKEWVTTGNRINHEEAKKDFLNETELFSTVEEAKNSLNYLKGQEVYLRRNVFIGRNGKNRDENKYLNVGLIGTVEENSSSEETKISVRWEVDDYLEGLVLVVPKTYILK